LRLYAPPSQVTRAAWTGIFGDEVYARQIPVAELRLSCLTWNSIWKSAAITRPTFARKHAWHRLKSFNRNHITSFGSKACL